MKARDGDTQVKKDQDGDLRSAGGRPGSKAGICPACKAAVPQKAGFRLSSLQCPKCGRLMGKQ